MIFNEQKPCKIITYITGVDDYGQTRELGQTERNSEIFTKVSALNNQQSPYYIDCDLIAISIDFDITPSNRIEIDGVIYNVQKTLPDKKYLLVFLKKWK